MQNIAIKYVLLTLVLLLSVACKQSISNDANGISLNEQPANQALEAHSGMAENQAILDAYSQKLSDVWLEGQGEVVKLLADDNKGARHQKFLVKISHDKTLLFAHNIDLAPRLDELKVGDHIRFKGEYVYNPKGGVMHWTHHDPKGQQQGGWIILNGKTYQ